MRCPRSCARRCWSLGQARLTIALRPDLDAAALTTRLSGTRGKQSLANFLRKAAQVSPVGIGLMQEAAIASGRPLASFSPADLANLINAIPVQLTGVAPIDRAISTAGGITFEELDDAFHAAPSARRVRSRRDAGLGSADWRLSAAGIVRDRARRGAGRLAMAFAIAIMTCRSG